MLAKLMSNKMVLGAVVGIVGGLIVAVLLVAVGGVGRSPSAAEAAKPGEKAAPTAKAPAKAGKDAAEERFGPTYVIKDRIVNLADPGGRRYLRFSVTIQFTLPEEAHAARPEAPAAEGGYQLMLYLPELDGASTGDKLVVGGSGQGKDPDKDFQPRIKPYAAAIEDAVTTVLSAKTYDEVRSGEGKEQVKREIKDRVQRIVAEKFTVAEVFLTDFVVQ